MTYDELQRCRNSSSSRAPPPAARAGPCEPSGAVSFVDSGRATATSGSTLPLSCGAAASDGARARHE
eukprot:6528756-Prymnesium_polylepis.2